MKIAAIIAGILLGLIFVVLPGALMLGLMKMPPPPAGSPAGQFFAVFYTTGWLKCVQILQIVGGVLVAIPKSRNFGLLVLGPILVNIAIFHFLVAQSGFIGLPLVACLLALFLLFVERRKFAALAN